MFYKLYPKSRPQAWLSFHRDTRFGVWHLFLDLFSATPKSIVYSLIGGLGNHHNLDTVRPFGYGWKDSYDIAYQAGFFLLSSIFLVSQSAYLWQKIILSSVGVILCVLIKVDLTITVALFTFFSLLICHPSLFRSRFALLFLGITLGVIFFVFSTTYSHLSFVWEISPGALLDMDSNAVLLLAIEALLILFLIAGFAVSNSTWRIFSPAITIPALLAITLPLLLFNVFKFQMLLNDRDITAEIPLENFFLAGNWILLPVCLAAYWSQHYRSRHRYFLHSFLVLPVFFPLLFIWNEKIKNIYTHAFFPEFVEGYVLNQSLGDVLQHVERSALLVTNDFRYPANNFDRDSLQMSLPALFGHQWYAVNYTYYRSAKGSEEILQRINLQKQILSQDEDTILREARERNWTHYLEHKGINPQAPLRTILPLAENDSYRVYRLSNN